MVDAYHFRSFRPATTTTIYSFVRCSSHRDHVYVFGLCLFTVWLWRLYSLCLSFGQDVHRDDSSKVRKSNLVGAIIRNKKKMKRRLSTSPRQPKRTQEAKRGSAFEDPVDVVYGTRRWRSLDSYFQNQEPVCSPDCNS